MELLHWIPYRSLHEAAFDLEQFHDKWNTTWRSEASVKRRSY